MSRISQIFKKLKPSGRLAFMPFIVAGDPNFKKSLSIVKTIVKKADLLEIGFPYTDPLADGPIIQTAHLRALKAGMNTDKVFSLIKQIRTQSAIPITGMVYANLVNACGVEKFYRKAKEADIDGILIPDVPKEEAYPFVRAANKNGIDQIFLISQTTSVTRLKKIERQARGFLYLVTVRGVTGVRKKFDSETLKFLERIQKHAQLPLAAGFGIANRRQIKQIKNTGINGFIVGSAIVKIIGTSSKIKIRINQLLNEYLN